MAELDTSGWTDADWAEAERCIKSVQATNSAFVAKINRHIENATTTFTDAGMSITFARRLAERCAENALNSIAEENFRGPKHG